VRRGHAGRLGCCCTKAVKANRQHSLNGTQPGPLAAASVTASETETATVPVTETAPKTVTGAVSATLMKRENDRADP
jgi:hypothetical protein